MMRSKQTWNWGAYGKHPVGKDYLRIGPKDPLLQAFSDWIQNGYGKLNPEHDSNPIFYSWRFWAKGPKKGSLVCGVGRDSSDSIGRPYPLLIMGTGPLKGWEDNWDLLPDACMGTWSQMEYLSTKRFSDFGQFESEVRLLKSPATNWSELRSNDREGALSLDDGDVDEMVTRLSHDKALFIPLDGRPSCDPHTHAGLWHSLLRMRTVDVPSAVFMGGSSVRTFLAVFRRALVSGDFVRLWSGGNVFEVEGQDCPGAVGVHRSEV